MSRLPARRPPPPSSSAGSARPRSRRLRSPAGCSSCGRATGRGRAPCAPRRCARAGRCEGGRRRRSARGACRGVAGESSRAAGAQACSRGGRAEVGFACAATWPRSRDAPGDGDAEAGRVRRVARVELLQRTSSSCCARGGLVALTVAVTTSLWQRRHDYLDAFALHRAEVDQVLLGRGAVAAGRRAAGERRAGRRARTRRRRRVRRPRRLRAGGVARAASALLRAHEYEALEQPLQVLDDLPVRVRRNHVLADRVERVLVVPGEQDVPLVGVLVHAIDVAVIPGAFSVPEVREARRHATERLRPLERDRLALRDRGPARVAAEVDCTSPLPRSPWARKLTR